MQLLKGLAEFKTSPELIDELYEHSIVKEFEPGSVIVSDNAAIRSIPIVVEGLLKVFRIEEDGREILLYYIKPGEGCVMSILGGMHNDTSKVKAEVEETATIIFLPVNKMDLFFKDYPQWTSYVFRMYHQRFEELLEVINAIAFKKVDERLLSLLRTKSKVTGSNVIHVTHEQLANELGTARVVVSRLLKQLEDNGEVELGRNKIEIRAFDY